MDWKEVAQLLIDEEGLKKLALEKLMDEVIKGKLDELVQKSDNTLDDALAAIVYPVLREEIEKQIDKLLGKMEPEPAA